jgi:hypothetical protein
LLLFTDGNEQVGQPARPALQRLEPDGTAGVRHELVATNLQVQAWLPREDLAIIQAGNQLRLVRVSTGESTLLADHTGLVTVSPHHRWLLTQRVTSGWEEGFVEVFELLGSGHARLNHVVALGSPVPTFQPTFLDEDTVTFNTGSWAPAPGRRVVRLNLSTGDLATLWEVPGDLQLLGVHWHRPNNQLWVTLLAAGSTPTPAEGLYAHTSTRVLQLPAGTEVAVHPGGSVPFPDTGQDRVLLLSAEHVAWADLTNPAAAPVVLPGSRGADFSGWNDRVLVLSFTRVPPRYFVVYDLASGQPLWGSPLPDQDLGNADSQAWRFVSVGLLADNGGAAGVEVLYLSGDMGGYLGSVFANRDGCRWELSSSAWAGQVPILLDGEWPHVSLYAFSRDGQLRLTRRYSESDPMPPGRFAPVVE